MTTQAINIAKIKYDETPIQMPQGQAFVKNITNRKLLQAAWKAAGLAPRYPLDTRSVFALLKLMGYAVSRAVFEYHVSREYFALPSKVRGCFVWTEREIVSFADSMESTRNWLPMHPCHAHKLNADEIAKATKEAAARSAAINAFDAMPTDEVIGLLATCETASTRELLAIALRKKLGLLNIRGDGPTTPNPEDN